MALIHDISDFRSWDGVQHNEHLSSLETNCDACRGKRLNIDYLACDLPADTTELLQEHWREYWDGETKEARLSQEVCAFEHLVALNEDEIASGDLQQPIISSPELQRWIGCLDSSAKEMLGFYNGATFGSSYWQDPDENMRLLAEVMSKDNLATSPLPFIRMARYMSTIKRRGWLKRGMNLSDVESNASHSWGVALICLLFSPKACTILRISYLSNPYRTTPFTALCWA